MATILAICNVLRPTNDLACTLVRIFETEGRIIPFLSALIDEEVGKTG